MPYETHKPLPTQSPPSSLGSIELKLYELLRMIPSLALLLLASLMLMLGGCSGERQLSVDTAPLTIARPPERPKLPIPAAVQVDDLKWQVVTPKVVPSLGSDWVLLALSPEQYEALGRNLGEVARWVCEARFQLHYYRGERSEPCKSGHPDEPGRN